MKNAVLLLVGVAAGVVVAHQVAKTPEGQKFFADADAKAREFGAAVKSGYRARAAELGDAFDDLAARSGMRAE